MMMMPVFGYDNTADLGIVWTVLSPGYGSGTGQQH